MSVIGQCPHGYPAADWNKSGSIMWSVYNSPYTAKAYYNAQIRKKKEEICLIFYYFLQFLMF